MLRAFLRNDKGAAAVEFAVIVPVLAAILVGLMVAWEPATAMLQMRAAVHAGATYVRQGGTNDTHTRSVVISSWEDKPASSSVSVSRQCLCGQTVSACTTICADQTPPSVYVTVAATSSNPEFAFGQSLSSSEVVRVR